MFRERERRSRCVNLLVQNGLSRSDSADIFAVQNRHTPRRSGRDRAAYSCRLVCLWASQMYVSNFESQIYLQRFLRNLRREVRIIITDQKRLSRVF